jgi:hypothetical protein
MLFVSVCLRGLGKVFFSRDDVTVVTAGSVRVISSIGRGVLVKRICQRLQCFPLQWPTCTSTIDHAHEHVHVVQLQGVNCWRKIVLSLHLQRSIQNGPSACWHGEAGVSTSSNPVCCCAVEAAHPLQSDRALINVNHCCIPSSIVR